MSLIIVRPQTIAPPTFGPEAKGAPAQYNFGLMLVGGDGSTWDLANGPVGLLPGPDVFTAPTVGHWWRTSPILDGSRWDGMRTGQKDVVLPVEVTGTDWADFRDRDAAFFRALHPSRECSLYVTSPDAVARSLGIRFVADSGTPPDMDPLLQGNWCSYALEFTAANPFWRGPGVVAEFFPQTPAALFPGPPFHINRSSASESSTITNPGDEPSYPRYTIVGPAATWTVGVGDAVVASSTPMIAGQSVTIDTDPTQLTVLDQTGASVYGRLTNDDFEPVPAGVDVQMSLEMTGFDTGPASTSRIRVEFDDLYRRPW